MSTQSQVRYSLVLALAGTVFAGYLSWTRMSSGVCAFDEPCPFFLGHPACYTGFALFAALLAVSLTALIARTESLWPAWVGAVLSSLGTLFAGAMTARELAAPQHYRMGLPTCAWGGIFFLAVLILSLSVLVSHARYQRPA